MASSRSASTAPIHTSTQASDTIWKLRLQDAEDRLVKDLRLSSDTIMKLCIEEDIIRDKDIKTFRRFRPDTRIREIIGIVSRGDRHTYERFREILCKAKQDAIYNLLAITEKDEAEQRSAETTSQPTSPEYTDESDSIWRVRLKDKEEALVDGLRLYPSTIVNKFKDEKMIKDTDILEIKKLGSEKQVRRIIDMVLLGNRKTYETFRKILKECKLTALYDLLDLKKARPEQTAFKEDKMVEKTSKKVKTLMKEMNQMRQSQSEEVEYLKALLQAQEQKCIRLAKINTDLRLQKAKLEKRMKTNESRNEAKRLEDELDGKQKAYQALERERDDLRKQLQGVEMNMRSDSN